MDRPEGWLEEETTGPKTGAAIASLFGEEALN